MTPEQVLNKRSVSKRELREALAQVLDLPCPTFEPAPSQYTQMLSVFCEYYARVTGIEYRFGARDAKALAELEKSILRLSPDAPVETWQAMLQNLPEFYRTKAFTLHAINNNFNSIAASIKQKPYEKAGVSNDYINKLRDTLQG